ncbi:MAG TPA: histidine phosphatase family protein [Terriglobales bacterium]|nr:histidine phosphatase family protein [Terriglobales bacterium]
MSSLLFIRHTETGMAGKFCGYSDPDLNERGLKQIAAVIRELSDYPISRIYTSDLQRALQTAQPIVDHFHSKLEVRPGLREIDFGLWEGLSWSEIETRYPVEARRWIDFHPNVAAPGGESYERFQARVRQEIEFLIEKCSNECIAVVTHAGFIREVLTRFCRVAGQEAWGKTKAYGAVISIDRDIVWDTLKLSVGLPAGQ